MHKTLIALALALTASLAQAKDENDRPSGSRAWNYETGGGGASPVSGTQRPTSGKNLAELEQQKDGSYEFRIRGGSAPACYKSFKPAQVEESDTTLTITPEPLFGNCECRRRSRTEPPCRLNFEPGWKPVREARAVDEFRVCSVH